MIATKEEQARVYKAVEAVLKAQTGEYKSAQHRQDQQATETGTKAAAAAQDAA
jgi:hypothetical protein